MMNKVTIALTPKALRVIERTGDKAPLLAAIAQAMDLANQDTVAHISKVRMRGNDWKPFPPEAHKLGIRSGRLYKSLHHSPAVVAGDQVVSTIGSNVVYAGVHEFGFRGTVTVKAHTRKRVSFVRASAWWWDKPVKVGRKRMIRIENDQSVRSHSRRMNMPARAPIWHGIQDNQARVSKIVSNAIVQWGDSL